MNRVTKLYQQIFGSTDEVTDVGFTSVEGQEGLQDDDLLETNPDALPIFVCNIALPDTKMPMHIFEPRYRLMIERCLQGSREFGVCIPTKDGYADIGTLLRIQKFWKLPDGRYFIETIGTKRFAVKEKFSDGIANAIYNCAKVEWIDDTIVEDPAIERRIEELRSILHTEVHLLRDKCMNEMDSALARYFLTKLYRMKISEEAIAEIVKHENASTANEKWYSLPTDPAALTWSILDFLPFPDDFKFRFLAVTNLQRRMDMVVVVLQSLRDIKYRRHGDADRGEIEASGKTQDSNGVEDGLDAAEGEIGPVEIID